MGGLWGALRSIQRFHQDVRGWDDIGYSFVVGSHGYIYQGRGWRWVGAHTKGYNSEGYGVAYVGDFSTASPDRGTMALVRDELLPCAVRTGRLHHNYTVRGHRQVGPTDCPGTALFQEIETWSGFKVVVPDGAGQERHGDRWTPDHPEGPTRMEPRPEGPQP
ncbi:N-acetylmuramoyl-L-alanine amidase [Cuculus canorus]|uniref:N-acetylmuramoyl-L-alanine amidase n=1 Tax=Cuculus canorus TaxID=55661 RepID=UPI0023AAED1A|nr:N-acetylmuramoyl-L-alanine amidase [Cuculus canorus]